MTGSVEHQLTAEVQQSFQLSSLICSTTRPHNVTIIKVRKDVGFEEEQKHRAWKKPG